MYALVDCNNFYASCEQLFQPWLIGKPVVVLSNNDGCIIARSQEAKDIGFKMGQPAFKHQHLFDKYDVRVFSSNYPLYADMSNRVMSTLSKFSPDIEIYSIDESFLSFHGFNCDLVEYSKKIVDEIHQNIGLPTCIGIGPTKTLSKAANYFAKKKIFNESKVFLISDENRDAILKNLPVEEIWGIGRQYSILLKSNGIYNAKDFTESSDSWIKKHLTINGLRLKKELLGMPCSYLEDYEVAKKSIITSRSFGKEVSSIEGLREAIATYASRCAYKLRRQRSNCKFVTAFIYTNRHKKNLPQYSSSRTINLHTPTNHTIRIVEAALEALKQIYKDNYMYKKAGVLVSGISSDHIYQTSLFSLLEGSNIEDKIKHDSLMETVDMLNNKYNKSKTCNPHTLLSRTGSSATDSSRVRLAVCGDGNEWKLKKEKISRCYTTRWNEIIVCK